MYAVVRVNDVRSDTELTMYAVVQSQRCTQWYRVNDVRSGTESTMYAVVQS